MSSSRIPIMGKPRAQVGAVSRSTLKWSSKRALKVATHPEARIFRKESAISVSTGILRPEKVAVEYAFKGP